MANPALPGLPFIAGDRPAFLEPGGFQSGGRLSGSQGRKEPGQYLLLLHQIGR